MTPALIQAFVRLKVALEPPPGLVDLGSDACGILVLAFEATASASGAPTLATKGTTKPPSAAELAELAANVARAVETDRRSLAAECYSAQAYRALTQVSNAVASLFLRPRAESASVAPTPVIAPVAPR